MSAVENIGSSVAASSTPAVTQMKTLGKDEFFKMLLAQLKNQDPMNPLQGTEFSAQLAQFSSLEQLTNLNNTLTAQSQNYMSLMNAQSINMIGKEITAEKGEGGSKTTINGQVTAVNFKDNAIYLIVNGENVPLSDVLSVKNATDI